MKKKFNLITTKFIIPAPRKNYILRENLLNTIHECLEYKLTIIKAMAGSGKTTLLSIYVEKNNSDHIKWITLDENNNETYSFWYYFCEAIKDYLGSDKINDYFNQIVDKDSIFNLIIYIINKLSKLNYDITLILDDFYYIKDEFLNSTIDYIIKYSSPNIHFIFVTREEVSLHLGNLREEGQLLEITENDLHFSQDDTALFLKNTLKLKLTPSLINSIYKKTEGWIAGIQLTALALKNEDDIASCDINLENTYITQYLTEEILDKLNPYEKDFLIKTSILKYFDVDICDRLLNINNSESIIESLISKNLFIILIDRKNKVYRYHNIFKQFLNTIFSKLAYDEQKEIHFKAYQLYKDINIEDAIDHLLKINLYSEAAIEIDKNLKNPQGWYYLKLIPINYLKDNEELVIQLIYYYFSNMNVIKCTEIINTIGTENMPILNIFKFLIQQDRDVKLKEINNFDIESSAYNNITKSILYMSFLFLYNYKNEYKKVLDLCSKVSYLAEKYNLLSLNIFNKSMEASALEDTGELLKALNIYIEIKSIIDKNPILSRLKSVYHFGAAGIDLKMCELKKAEDELKTVSSSIDIEESIFSMPMLYHLALLNFLKGDINKALNFCNILNQKDPLSFGFSIGYKMCLECYNKNDLKEFINKYKDKIENNKFCPLTYRISYARALYLYGKHKEGIDLINNVIEFCRENSIKTYLVDSLICLISILNKNFKQNKREIFSFLREAIYYSSDNSYLLPFLLEFKRLKKIIDIMNTEKNIIFTIDEKKFINKLDNLDKIKNNKTKTLLSNREQEVLNILSERLTNKEIAEKLNISLATVKTHIINIYSKLNVNNRMQAIEKAKELSLI